MTLASSQQGSGVLEETKRVARLLDIIARISTRPRVWTRGALAAAFEISERRIQQDLEILVHRLHLPLAHSREGYYLTEPRSVGAVSFAFGEAVALLLAANVGRSMVGVGSAELAAAMARLKEAFPIEFRRLLDAVGAPATNGGDGRRQRLVEMLQETIATRRSVQMTYATASRDGAESVREVDPYALVPYVRSFHLVGYCHTRGEVRIFKVDRILQLRVAGRAFEVPADFDLQSYLGDAWGLMRGEDAAPEQVEMRFSAKAGRWVSEEHWHASQRAEWQADGSLRFTVRMAITPAFIRWVLYYGGEARVLQPEWLAEAVCQEAMRTVARYHSDRVRPSGPHGAVTDDEG